MAFIKISFELKNGFQMKIARVFTVDYINFFSYAGC